jgi:hypothetical protein
LRAERNYTGYCNAKSTLVDEQSMRRPREAGSCRSNAD